MRISVRHVTTYSFEPPMRGVVQSYRLTPSRFEGQRAVSWSVDVPGATRGARFRDGAGDTVETVSFLGPVAEVVVDVAGLVDTRDLSGVLRGHREQVPPEVYLSTTRMTEPDDPLRMLAAEASGRDPLDRAHRVMEAVAAAIRYTPGETESATTAAEALALGQGVCQDHSHAMIAAATALGYPARYVTGYLQAGADGTAHEASHAWSEIWLENLGWVGFDAANGQSPDDRYIRLGSGFDALDAAPIRGVAQGAGVETLNVDVAVEQVQQQQ